VLFAILNTLHTLGPARIKTRLMRRFRYRFLYPRLAHLLFPSSGDGSNQTKSALEFFHEKEAAQIVASEKLLDEADNLCHHRFCFLNLPLQELGYPVKWSFIPDGDRLWQYNLHYGEWALTLLHTYMATKQKNYLDALMNLLSDWIEHNPVGKGPGWEPYPVSRRLTAWARVGLSLLNDDMFKDFWKNRLAPSLHQQTRVLASNLEFDLSNNHLIANYKALAWMGLLFPHWPYSDRWKTIGLNGLWSEMQRQVLPDGVHDERSISYHTIVLQDLLETWYLCRETSRLVPDNAEEILKKMMQFLADMISRDGSCPMLNDTVQGYPLDPRSVLLAGGVLFDRSNWISLAQGADTSYASLFTKKSERSETAKDGYSYPKVKAYPDAGYVVLRDERGGSLCFDAGPMGPNHLPGHGHADALSFELFAGGRWLVVDPGVYSYHDKQWRDYFRGTKAHNTVSIDDEDQCVFWGAFRVAYPPKVRLIDWSETHVEGEHEGYSRLRHPVIHRRRIERRELDEWEIGDHFHGKGEHDFILTLQLSPGAEAIHEGKESLVKWPDGIGLQISVVSLKADYKVAFEESWVSPGWNIKDKAMRYVLKWRSNLPAESHLVLKIVV
jgi:hypothetical protein